MSITGDPGQAPIKAGSPITDINAGILAALGVVAAYVHRLKTGEGQIVDTSLMEAGVQQTYWQAAIFFATGVSPGPTGSAHILAAPYQAFPTRDGWINVGGANPANWLRLTKLVGMPELAEDPRFKTNAARMKNLDALTAILSACLKQRGTREWLAELDAAGIPAGPINKVGEMLADPQVVARDMVVELAHPKAGRTKAIGLPVKFSATPGGIRRPAPLFGEHTREILVELGYDDADIVRLVKEGAVAVA